MNKPQMHNKQTGAAHLALVCLLIVLAGVAGVGYYVLRQHRKTTNSTASSALAVPATIKTTTSLVEPNGTVSHLSEQIDTSDTDETQAEDTALKAEDSAATIDQKSVDNVKGGTDAASL